MTDVPHSSLLPVEWAVASRPLPGQTALGDGSLVKPGPDGIVFAVVDGLGHGTEAARVTAVALDLMGHDESHSVVSLVRLCHDALRQTRGVVMTVASIDFASDQLTWLGIGNVDAVLLRSDPENPPAAQNVLLRPGVVGYQLPGLQTDLLTVRPGDLLVFNTDGIRPDFAQAIVRKDPVSHIAQSILGNFFKGTDDALVLVARYHGRKP